MLLLYEEILITGTYDIVVFSALQWPQQIFYSTNEYSASYGSPQIIFNALLKDYPVNNFRPQIFWLSPYVRQDNHKIQPLQEMNVYIGNDFQEVSLV